MALALLRADESGGAGQRWFRYDIGRNRFYRYAVGGPERRREDGVTLLAEPLFISPIAGPVPESAMGMGRFAVDESRFGGEAEFVQMMSYASPARDNPAISAVVRARRALPDYPPPPVLTEGFSRRRMSQARAAAPLSQALFLGELLKMAGPMIGSLLGGLGGGGGGQAAPAGGSAPAPGPLARLADPATLKLLQQLVEQIAGMPAAPSKSQAQALGYSNAMIAPALLAALPALMPLLQQVLNPQTIKAVLDAPNQAAGTIINGVQDVLKLGLQANEAHMKHLREIHPGLEDPALDRLMEGLGIRRGGRTRKDAFRRTSRVRIAFDGLRSVTAGGRSGILFARGHAIRLPLTVELPLMKSGRPPALRNPSLLLEVKDPKTLAVRKRVRARLPTITESGAIEGAELSAGMAAELEAGRDWLFSVTLSWKSRNGERIGVVMSTLAQIAGPLVYDGLEDEGEAIDLADPTEHRAFWHRVWNSRFAAEAKRYDAEIDYGYRYDPKAVGTRRVDTRIRTRPAENSVARVDARISAELVYGPDALADVAAAIGLDAAPLSADERAALADPGFIERASLGARMRVPIRGRTGEAFAFWAYPAVRRAMVRFGSPSEILETGNIAALEYGERTLVIPAALNLIGSRGR